MELGAFTSDNNREDGQFVTQPILGDKIYIEYFQSSEVKERAILKLGAVVCIFDDSFLRKGPFSKEASPACNVNTICSEASGWESEVKSVGLILEKDDTNQYWGLCSGSLINKSTAYLGSDKPLFLSANHCYEENNVKRKTDNWIFLFRHEGLTCLDDGSTIPRSYTKSITGASVLSADLNSKTSDYLLLQLNCTVDQISSFDVSFAGWSRNESDGYSDKTVAIHHPQGDIKKFTYTTAIPASATNDYNNNTYFGGLNAMWKVIWTYGVTAPGSSGGPLFNNDHKIIGQLYYGASTCDLFWQPDYYGKFSTSFINGNFQNYLGSNLSVQSSTPSKPTLDLTITSNPVSVAPGTNVSFTASSSNKFGNLTCWWIINTEQGDLDVTCNANTDAYCNASNSNPTQSFYFGSAGNYKITLWATDDAGKLGSKEFILIVKNDESPHISVDFLNTVCKNQRSMPLGSKVGFFDYTNPKYYSYKVKEIDWYYDNVLINQDIYDGSFYIYAGSRGCFSLNAPGKHFIKIKAYAAQVQANGSYTKLEPPATVTKEILVVDCNSSKDISTQTMLNAYNGYIAEGTISLNPSTGTSLLVSSGSKLNVDTYNKAILKPGVKFESGSSCLIKAFNCTTPQCDCSTWTKSAKINSTITEIKDQAPINNKINVYPNPINNYAIIDLGNLVNEVLKIELVDVAGKLLFNQDCDFLSINYINTQNLVSGLYFVKVSTNNGQVVKKMVKK
ncbi:MAG: T9SS type A sorting domain-containing protein [Bacteroidota bacterium]|nr:T9SS type A sorting domain-containing protein [Bacteroidota bacterium]